MRSTPLMASSSGVPTVWASTAGFAAGYTARTLIGSERIAISPAARMTSERTTAKMGRSMKKREKRTRPAPERDALARRPRGRGGVGQHGGGLGGDLHARAHTHQTVYD